MAHRASRSSVRSAVLAAVLLQTCSGPVWAAPASPLPPVRPAVVTEPDLLKVLPASRDELIFRGENSDATWPVYFSRAEAARTSVLQLGLLNTVSLLPERSTLRVTVNGRTLANMQIRSPEKVSLVPVRIPPGVLVPGFNAVQISVAMAHRVDCSVRATYELWTLLNPAQTGFMVPAQPAATVRTLDDLAAEVAAEDGTTRIHLRVPADADAELLSRGANAIATIVTTSHLLRPIVDVGPEAGKGPGFDLILGNDPGQDGVTGRQNGMAFRRDPESHRMMISIADDPPNGSDLGITGDQRAFGTPQGLRSFENMSGVAVDGARRLTFADLGIRTESSAGRRYLNAIGVTLPDDFYPGNYNKVELYLDGTHAAGLAASAALVFRVNGMLVSSLSLGPSSPERFEHAQVDLPLQFFRPGYNEVEVEGLMPTTSDEQCDLTAASSGPRLSIADTSELVIPRFARLQTAPQIMSTIRFGTERSEAPVDLYLVGSDYHLIGAAMTVVANMAARDRTAGRVRLHRDQPGRSDKSGIVIGSMDALPELLADPLHAYTDSSRVAATASDSESQTAVAESDQTGRDSTPIPVTPAMRDRVGYAYTLGQQWLRSRGFFFASGESEGSRLPISNHSLLVADVLMDHSKPVLGGVDLPSFATAPKNWVVVTGATDAVIADGLHELVASSRWKDLNGEAVVYDPTSGKLQGMQPRTLTYVLPDAVPFGDLRPILGGVMSSNIVLSTVVLLVLLSLLGMTTHVLLRFVGERAK